MPFMNVTQYSGASVQANVVVPAPVEPSILSEDVAVSGTTAKTATAFDDGCTLVTISSDVDIRYAVGDFASATAAATDTYLPAGQIFSFVPAKTGLGVAAITA